MNIFERVLKLDRRLRAINENLRLGVGYMESSDTYYMMCQVSGKVGAEYGLQYLTDEEIIEKCKELVKTKYTLITKACIDLINETVWLDKKEPVKVIMIVSKTHILADDGEEYPLDRLYIKE